MILADAAHPYAHADYVITTEARAVHDTATLKLSDYRASNGSDWVVAAIEPASDSGTVQMPGAYINVDTGEIVQPADAHDVVVMKGAWRTLATADSSVPSRADYSWTEVPKQRIRIPTPDDFYSPFKEGGTVVFQWEPSAEGKAQFSATRMIFPEWAQDVAETLRSAPGIEGTLVELADAGKASTEADEITSAKNNLSSVLIWNALLHGSGSSTIVARMPALLETTDARKLSVLVYLCLAASAAADRPTLVTAVKTLIGETTDSTRLASIAYASYAVKLFDPTNASAQNAASSVLAQLKSRTTALHVRMDAHSPWTLIFEKTGQAPPRSFRP
ncbi:hypothetical protein BWP39_16485 [Paraburkholderia acidicola]|uniref:Uncharacterized protein n=1 Tax=Paraburkholderia acidicola TaxID=1912599 RepID=A0A2A4F0A1_9BURK|nr:hypothetical protein [Paraburkholderia acidicola]PCE26122.1 hypothetical protein BWP39_16485 [Paraburkholderia acidicola]